MVTYTPEQLALSVKLGFGVEIVADTPYTPMMQLMTDLQKRDETFLNERFGHLAKPMNMTVMELLKHLETTLPLLPRDETGAAMRKYMILSITLTIITCLAVALRFVSRKYITPKEIRIDDWACFAALVSQILYMCSVWVMSTQGKMSKHVWEISLWDYRNLYIYLRVGEMFFFAAHQVVKTAFLVFFYRIFVSRPYRLAIWGMGLFVTSLTIIGVFGVNFQCLPVDFWNHFSTKTCMNTKIFFIARSTLYSLSDIMILILPVPGILRLQIPKREKVMLIGVFSIGIFITIASVKRLFALWSFRTSLDTFYLLIEHNNWACVELELGIIIMCAPALKVLLFHKNSPVASIPTVVINNWSRHGSYKSERKTSGSFLNTFRRNRQTGTKEGDWTDLEITRVSRIAQEEESIKGGVSKVNISEELHTSKSEEQILKKDEETASSGGIGVARH